LVFQQNNVEKQEFSFPYSGNESVLVVKVNTDSGIQVGKIVN